MPVRIIEGHIVCPDHDLAEHAALLAQPLGERSRVDSHQTGNSFLLEPLRETVTGRRVTVAVRQLGNDEPRYLNSSRLERPIGAITRRHSIIADERVRQNQYLAAV